MGDDLEDRLRSHARAFEGLMSLIPAERYYEKDNTDEWRKKKQTPEERKAARMAKLNPDNHKSAKDVMDDNERKRKREIEAEAKQTEDDASIVEERPGEGLKQAKTKRVKTDEAAKSGPTAAVTTKKSPAKALAATTDKSDDQKAAEKAQKKKEKEEAKKEKIARKEEKRAAKKAAKKAAVEANDEQDTSDQDADDQAADISMTNAEDLDAVDVSGLADPEPPTRDSSASPSPELESVFSAQQSASSTSSLDTAFPASSTIKSRPQIPEADKAALQARLQARIEALRAARKADGPDGRPAKNRAELIEARRKKAELRKQSKKDQRALAKDDEVRAKAEAELARLRGSGSPLGSDIFSPSIPRSPDTSFNFGRVAFQDGQQLDSNLSYFTHKPQKGPSDAKTAFLAAKNKQSRLSGLDEEKRNDIEEKDMWLNAKKKVHGERVRDDASLLKKTLKRTEKLKKKSEKEWDGRIDGVKKGIAMREKKRDDNLKKRKEEKGGKGKKKSSAAPSKKRPGFEGGFRSKPGK